MAGRWHGRASGWRGVWGLIVCLLLIPGPALAGRVAVLAFDGGASARRVRASLVRRLVRDARIEVVSRSSFGAAAREAGVRQSALRSASGIRRAAAVAAVDAVVYGQVRGRGRRARVWIDVWDDTGRRRLHRAYRLRHGGLRGRDLERLARFLGGLGPAPVGPGAAGDEGVRGGEGEATSDETTDRWSDSATTGGMGPEGEVAAEGGSAGGPADGAVGRPDGSVAGKRGVPPGSGDERTGGGPVTFQGPGRAEGATGGGQSPASSGQRPYGGEQRGERLAERPWPPDQRAGGATTPAPSLDDPRAWGVEPIEPAPVGGVSRAPWTRLWVLGQVASRDYLLQGTYTTVEYRTRGAFPEAGLSIEISPAARGGPWLQDLSVIAEGSYGFLYSQFKDATGAPQRVATPVVRASADLRYRAPLAPASVFSPRLGLRLGYTFSRFVVPVGNPLFRTITHSGPRVGAEIYQPLLPPFLALTAFGSVLPFGRPGESETLAYGSQASSSGLWVEVGFEGSLRPMGAGLTWKVLVSVLQYGDHFAGTGTEDADASAREEHLVLVAGLGYAF